MADVASSRDDDAAAVAAGAPKDVCGKAAAAASANASSTKHGGRGGCLRGQAAAPAPSATAGSLAACLAVAAVLAAAAAALTGRVPTPGGALVGAVRFLVSGPSLAMSAQPAEAPFLLSKAANVSFLADSAPLPPEFHQDAGGLRALQAARRLATAADTPPSGYSVKCAGSRTVTLRSLASVSTTCPMASDSVVSIAIDNPSACKIMIMQCTGSCESSSEFMSSTRMYHTPESISASSFTDTR